MLTADDDVQRLTAAHVVALLADDGPGSRLELIASRLDVEENPHIAAVLMSRLSRFRFEHAAQVDSILGNVLTRAPWASLIAASASDDERDSVSTLVSLVLWLAFRGQTPVAERLVANWAEAPTTSEASRWSLHGVRDWLALPADDAATRFRAFDFIRTAASSLALIIGSNVEQQEINAAYLAADSLVHAVFFASGAHGERGSNPTAPPPGFTEEALPLLTVLAEFRHPAVVHYLVQTADHLATISPRGAFAVVHKAVRPDEPYAYDQLAADVTVALIERYLAGYRDLVVSNSELLSEIRSVLNAFAKAGWPSAVSLSYRLGSVFR